MMADANRDDLTPANDIEANDAGSVVTYHDDQSLSPQPPAGTSAVSKMAHPPSALARLRQMLGDVCDTVVWEAVYVSLSMVFSVVTLVECAMLWENGLGSISGLQGLSAFLASLLAAFLIECVVKTVAFGSAFLRVEKNVFDFALVVVRLFSRACFVVVAA